MCQDWVVFLRRQHVRSALGAAPTENLACRTARPQLLVTACRCAQVVLLSSVRSQFGAAWRIAGAALGCTTLACLLVIQRRAGSWQSDQQKERTLVDLVSVDTAFSLWASWTTIAAGCTIADAAAAVGGWDRRTMSTIAFVCAGFASSAFCFRGEDVVFPVIFVSLCASLLRAHGIHDWGVSIACIVAAVNLLGAGWVVLRWRRQARQRRSVLGDELL